MKLNNKWIVGASALVAAGGTMAQSQKFEGGALNLGLGNMKFENETSSTTASRWKNTSNIEYVQLKTINDKWLLGFGVGLDLGTAQLSSGDAGGQTAYFDYAGTNEWESNSNDCIGGCYEYFAGGSSLTKVSRQLSISLIPAYAFSDRQLGFIRLGYSSAKVTQTGAEGASGFLPPWEDFHTEGAPTGSQSVSGKANLNGFVLGVGYRHQLDNKWFFQGEYKVVQYKRNSRLDTKPTSKGLVLGLGYQF